MGGERHAYPKNKHRWGARSKKIIIVFVGDYQKVINSGVEGGGGGYT